MSSHIHCIAAQFYLYHLRADKKICYSTAVFAGIIIGKPDKFLSLLVAQVKL